MRPGDVFCTNDPWLSVGHYHDVTVVTPAFRNGRAVGLLANTCHIVDMGGRGFGPDARQVYEEGINIPVMRLARGGRVNEDLMDILRTNVRNAADMEGDFYAMMNCNDEGARRLVAMLEEFGLEDIENIGDYIIGQSRRSIRNAIAELPDGTYSHATELDGFDEPIRIQAALKIEGSDLSIDYAGSSPESPFGINVVENFCIAYTVFGVNCVVGPNIPCNAGSIGVASVQAPKGCILNAQRPAPVSARHVIGQMLPDVVLGCLSKAIPDRVSGGRSRSDVEPDDSRRADGDRSGDRGFGACGRAGLRCHPVQYRRHRRPSDHGRHDSDRVPERRSHASGLKPSKRPSRWWSGARSSARDQAVPDAIAAGLAKCSK